MFYIVHENEPYFVAGDKMYACEITPEGISCDFKLPMPLPKKISGAFSHSGITAFLAERIENATAPVVKTRKKAKDEVTEE